ncbi:hypothetical protein L1987_04639 [Smallanthus sonchifolius]|uniref:Uncharacterized protein n=1 Tax=Smallanthus sonchifolius TaxID=185202 RepID=A0ACB9JT45_9ASTR|nr:hypothetical protein L1987_04639 [Smallanthus sonchifolius]
MPAVGIRKLRGCLIFLSPAGRRLPLPCRPPSAASLPTAVCRFLADRRSPPPTCRPSSYLPAARRSRSITSHTPVVQHCLFGRDTTLAILAQILQSVKQKSRCDSSNTQRPPTPLLDTINYLIHILKANENST